MCVLIYYHALELCCRVYDKSTNRHQQKMLRKTAHHQRMPTHVHVKYFRKKINLAVSNFQACNHRKATPLVFFALLFLSLSTHHYVYVSVHIMYSSTCLVNNTSGGNVAQEPLLACYCCFDATDSNADYSSVNWLTVAWLAHSTTTTVSTNANSQGLFYAFYKRHLRKKKNDQAAIIVFHHFSTSSTGK